jgi:hypothetical protein
MDIEIKEIDNFLREANKATYADKNATKVSSLRPKSEDYHFEKGDLAFHDTYFGSRDFLGEEVIYKNGTPLWAMNYYGSVLDQSITTDVAYKILRPALMQDPGVLIPVRGPEEYKEGDFFYRNSIEGDLSKFTGIEEILLKNKVICKTLYHGGLIK